MKLEALNLDGSSLFSDAVWKVAGRWAGRAVGYSDRQVVLGMLKDALRDGSIVLGYREVTSPPGVEVWVYRPQTVSEHPLKAILAVAFAKYQGRHVVWVPRGPLARSPKDPKAYRVCERRMAGDEYDVGRGLLVALGRAVRQALDTLHAQGFVAPREAPQAEPVPF